MFRYASRTTVVWLFLLTSVMPAFSGDTVVDRNGSTDRWTAFINSTYPSCIAIFAGNTWIGTRDGGILVLDHHQGDLVSRFTTANSPIASNTVIGLSPSHDTCLWVATSEGIAAFSPRTGWSDRSQPGCGLPDLTRDTEPTVVAVAPDGSAWVSIDQKGIYRYNGVRWESILDQSPSFPLTLLMYRTKSIVFAGGAVWFGLNTFFGGESLVRYLNGSWTSFFMRDGIVDMAVGRRNRIGIAGHYNRAFRLVRNAVVEITPTKREEIPTFKQVESYKGTLYWGTTQGVARQLFGSWVVRELESPRYEYGSHEGCVFAVGPGKSFWLWDYYNFDDNEKIYKWERRFLHWRPVRFGITHVPGFSEYGSDVHLAMDDEDSLWYAAGSVGSEYFVNRLGLSGGPAKKRVRRIFVSSQGVLGVLNDHVVNCRTGAKLHGVSNLPIDSVAFLAGIEDKSGGLWMGLNRMPEYTGLPGLLARFEDNQTELFDVQQLTGLQRRHILPSAVDTGGAVWFVMRDHTHDPAYQYGPRRHGYTASLVSCSPSRTWKLYDSTSDGRVLNRVTRAVAGPHGELWVGTWGDGLHRHYDGTWSSLDTLRGGLPGMFVSPLVVDKNGAVWCGISKPLIQRNWHSYAYGNAHRNDTVVYPVGLAKYSAGSTVLYTTRNSSLPSNDVRSAAFDSKGNLWIGTHLGIACLEDAE